MLGTAISHTHDTRQLLQGGGVRLLRQPHDEHQPDHWHLRRRFVDGDGDGSRAVRAHNRRDGLLAGASSMACGEWLSMRAEQECHDRELRRERDHLQTMPEVEAKHMKEILTSAGLCEETADAVNRDVARLPIDKQVAFHGQFELGIEVDDGGRKCGADLRSAATMWLSFALGAALPPRFIIDGSTA